MNERRTARAGSGASLQEGVTRAIEAAALEELATQGFGRLSMEAVARRAGVGKAALYRRWASRDEMVVDLVSEVGVEYAEAPDTGSLEGDVHAFLWNACEILREPRVARIASQVYAELATASPLAELIRATMQPIKQERTSALLARAVARGELPGGADAELAADLLSGPLYWRLVVQRGPADPALVARLAAATAAALRTLGAG